MITFIKGQGVFFSATPYTNGVDPKVGDFTLQDDARQGSQSEAYTIVSQAKRVLRIINKSGCQ